MIRFRKTGIPRQRKVLLWLTLIFTYFTFLSIYSKNRSRCLKYLMHKSNLRKHLRVHKMLFLFKFVLPADAYQRIIFEYHSSTWLIYCRCMERAVSFLDLTLYCRPLFRLSVVLKMNAISVADFGVHWWLTYKIIKYVLRNPRLLIPSIHCFQISLAMYKPIFFWLIL